MKFVNNSFPCLAGALTILSAEIVVAHSSPPLIAQNLKSLPWPGLEGFLKARLLPESDPELVTSFRNLYLDSPRFKGLVERLWTEQPQIQFGILPMKDQNQTLMPKPEGTPRKTTLQAFGSCVIQPTPNGYKAILLIQTKPARLGMDTVDAWMAQMLFALLELTTRDSVLDVGRLLVLDRSAQRKMWNFQRLLRGELKAAHPDHYKAMIRDGEYLFLTELQ
jgi:hypothetical protein